MSLPRHILVLGGTLPIARHIIYHLVFGGVLPEGSTIRAVDRRLLSMAHLSPKHEQAYAKVEYIQANLSDPKAVERVFQRQDKSGAQGSFDWVFNCASDAGEWEVEEVWRQRYVERPLSCARQAVATGVQVYIHLSSGNFYPDDPDEFPNESLPLVGEHDQAKYTRLMEEALQSVPGLPLVLFRPAFPWGLEDRSFTLAVLVSCDLHTRASEPWVFLWNKKHKVQGCNYIDIARAFHHVAKWYETANIDKGKPLIYNLAGEKGVTSVELMDLYKALFPDLYFSIPDNDDLIGDTVSFKSMKEMQTCMNRTLEGLWLRLLDQHGIKDCPLIPYIGIEFLTRQSFRVDGSAITRDTGFQYKYDGTINKEAIGEIMQDYMDRGLWPSRALHEPAPKNTVPPILEND